MLADGLFTLLSSDAAVSAIVSARVYPLFLPQNAVYPCINYDIDESEEDASFDGQGTFGQVTVTINCWETTYAKSLTLGAAVKAVLKNYTGLISGVNVQQLRLTANAVVYDETVTQEGLYRVTQLYTLTR